MLFTTLRSQEQAYRAKKWSKHWQNLANMLEEDLYNTLKNQILFIPIILSIGIGIYFSLPNEPSTTITLGLYALSTLTFISIRKLLPLHILYGICTIWIALTGFTSAKLRTAYLDTPQITKDIRYIELTGQIDLIERLSEGEGLRLTLSAIKFPENKYKKLTANKVRLRLRKAAPDDYRVGQEIKGLASLKRPPGPVSHGAFNYRRQLYFDGISAVGFLYHPPEVTKENSDQSHINQIRDHINLSISNETNSSQLAAGVMSALVTGIRAGIPEELQEDIRAAGLAHLLAISGLHVGMITAASFFAIRLLLALWPSFALRYSTKKTAAVGSLVIAFAYVLIAGSGVPALRAFITSSLIVCAIAIDRNPFSLRVVAIVASALLLFTPEILLGASFQMSFAAVVTLIAFYESTKKFWISQYGQGSSINKVKSYILALSATSIVASLATAPMSIYHFQHLANYSLLSNMLAVPLMGAIVMPFLLISVLLMPLGLEWLTLPIAGWGTDQMITIASETAALKYAHITIPIIPFTAYLALICSALCLIILPRTLKLLTIIPILCALIVFVNQKPLIGFIADTADQFLICPDPQNCYALNRISNRYLLHRWSEQFALPYKDIKTVKKSSEQQQTMKCDEHACRTIINDKKISIIMEATALTDDCLWADQIWALTQVSNKNCKTVETIDRFDLWKSGHHSIYMNGNTFEIKTVKEYLKNRPWS